MIQSYVTTLFLHRFRRLIGHEGVLLELMLVQVSQLSQPSSEYLTQKKVTEMSRSQQFTSSVYRMTVRYHRMGPYSAFNLEPPMRTCDHIANPLHRRKRSNEPTKKTTISFEYNSLIIYNYYCIYIYSS